MTIQKPYIGVTLDCVNPDEQPEGNWYSKVPWYALRYKYVDSVVAAGGVPLPLPHNIELVDYYISILDGLVVTGGGYDVDPILYGVKERHPTVTTKPGRTNFEWTIIDGMFKAKKPILGICGGMQLINVVFGGSLIQHIPDETPSDINHVQDKPRHEAQHVVYIEPKTMLHGFMQQETSMVNSVHHQAIKNIGSDIRINAKAADGIIEGIEHTNHPFCLGLQWHPEFHVAPLDEAIFNNFISACTK